MAAGEGLDKDALKTAIIAATQETAELSKASGATPEQCTEKFAELLANAIDVFVRSGKVRVYKDIPVEIESGVDLKVNSGIPIEGTADLGGDVTGATTEDGAGETTDVGTGKTTEDAFGLIE